MKKGLSKLLAVAEAGLVKAGLPDFRPGDSVKVHNKIVEGSKERIQMFEGVVIKRSNGNTPTATFTVRKVSYGIGVEKTFPLFGPCVDKIEVTSRGEVTRARLFYLRDRIGKAAKVKGAKRSANDSQAANSESPKVEHATPEQAADHV